MAKKMLIDATHPEETRVVVVDGNKVDDFDFESVNKKQLAGNIYLAKVTRVEPSLQAAFVDYGGNRHGFLAFAEIHPDYYQIPVADREALIAEEAAIAAREAENEDEGRRGGRNRRSGGGRRSKGASESEEASSGEAASASNGTGDGAEDGDAGGEESRGGRSRRSRGRRGKRSAQPVAEDNGIAGFGVIDPEGGGLDGAPEPNSGAGEKPAGDAAEEAAERAAETPADEAVAAEAPDAPADAAESEAVTAGDDAAPSDEADKDVVVAASGDDGPADPLPEAAAGAPAPEPDVVEPTSETTESEDGSETPPRSIAESAGLEGEDDVVRGDVPSDAAEPAAEDAEAAEKPKPKRRRAPRKPKAHATEPAADETAKGEAEAGAAAPVATEDTSAEAAAVPAEAAAPAEAEVSADAAPAEPEPASAAPEEDGGETATPAKPRRSRRGGKRTKKAEETAAAETADETADAAAGTDARKDDTPGDADKADDDGSGESGAEDGEIDTVGAEDLQEEDLAARAIRRRRYKIQDVVKSRQIMLVQVVKEERGTKGAALTTYLSLAGRYCVLMPNTARGGGISRKITNASDRKRLREIVGELEVPQGMGLIVRTAGAERTRAEIKRDYEFLLRQWEQIRELTLRSSAPCLIYEEGSLIKRSIRDIYSKEIDAVLVEGEAGYREAKDYMKMLMPSHAKNVQQYQDHTPLFIRYQVESYLNGMFSPVVQLKSGGYLVIGITEALVAIDVNSGRSTKEGSIEETATKTNLEAADEVARQLRLRDLAGLIVIDFIDMDESRNNRAVEKRMKDRLKNDRARIQVGRISGFGLMEMSRQRLRPGMLEATTKPCPHCHGQGFIRSDESMALGILREIEEEGVKGRASQLMATMPMDIANFIFNSKRQHLARIETRYDVEVQLLGDPALVSPEFRIERVKGAERRPERAEASAISAERSADLIDDAEIVEVPEGDGGGRDEGRRQRDNRSEGRGDSRGDSRGEGRGDGRSEARGDDARDDGEGGGKKRRRGKRGGRRRRGGNGEDREREETQQSAVDDAAERDDADTPVAADEAPVANGADTAASTAPEAKPETSGEPATAAPETETETADVEPMPEPTPEAEAEPEAATPAPADAAASEPEPEPDPTPDVPIEVAAAEAGRAAAGISADAVPEPVPEEPAKPKRRGWWSLRR
ncbi:MAG: Rne/Rng family ribonuclease [Pseudomonadota bacterium]